MPLFPIEHNFAEAAEMNPDTAADIKRVNDDPPRPVLLDIVTPALVRVRRVHQKQS